MINKQSTPFLDMLFNMVLCFVLLFFYVFILVRPVLQEAEVKKPKAEYLVTLEWQDDAQSDVDLWVADPANNVVWFRQQEAGIMFLDRDDLGAINDTTYDAQGNVIKVGKNQEIVSIRGFMQGEWVVNIHMYNLRDSFPVVAKVELCKLNPQYKRVHSKLVTFKEQWEEITIGRYEMRSDGEIINVSNLHKNLVQSTYRPSSHALSGRVP